VKYPDCQLFARKHAEKGRELRRADQVSPPSTDGPARAVSRREIIKLAAGGALGGLAAAVGIPVNAKASTSGGFSDGISTHSKVNLDQKGLQLVLTGCDCAFPAPFSAGASFALVIDGRILQFGFGRGAMQNLSIAGIDPMKIDEVYLTRLSVDYVAEYNYFVTTSMIAGRQKEILVFGPPGTKGLSDIAAESLHKATQNHLRHLHDCTAGSLVTHRQASCKVTELAAGIVGHKDLYRITASRGGSGRGEVTSLIYRIDSDYGSVALSTGAGPSEAMERLARNVDILVHHFTVPNHGQMTDESSSFKAEHESEGYISPETLGKFASKANVKMLIPYHSQLLGTPTGEPRPAPSPLELSEAIGQNFSGSVMLADDRMILTMS